MLKEKYLPKINSYPKAKIISQGRINRKANRKLDYVVEKYKDALGAYVESTTNDFMFKQFYFRDLHHLNQMSLTYKIENRLFAISYDPIYQITIFESGAAQLDADCTVHAKLSGKLHIKDAYFAAKDKNLDNEKVNSLIERLNNPLIIERIVSLNLMSLELTYSLKSKSWKITCKSIIGSTTWNLIPPVTYLVTPKEEECVQMIELFELIANILLVR